MKPTYRKSPFAFAEIMVTAPWAHRLLTQHSDHDKVELLQRNNEDDERSHAGPYGPVALEARARTLRAQHLGRLLQRAAAALFRRAHARA